MITIYHAYSDLNTRPPGANSPGGVTRLYKCTWDGTTFSPSILVLDETHPGWGSGSGLSEFEGNFISYGPDQTIWYNALDLTQWQVNCDNIPGVVPLWGLAKGRDYNQCGLWKIGTVYWAVIQYYYNISGETGSPNHMKLAVIKSTAYDSSGNPTAWTAPDLSNAPNARGGQPNHFYSNIAWRNLSDRVIFFNGVDEDGTSFHLSEFIFSTELYDVIPGSSFTPTNLRFNHNDASGSSATSIYKWANGDIGVVYSAYIEEPMILIYQLFNGTWQAPVSVASNYTSSVVGQGGNIQVIPDGEQLHVFYRTYSASETYQGGEYRTIQHAGTVSSVLQSFPYVRGIGFESAVFKDGKFYVGYSIWPFGAGKPQPNRFWTNLSGSWVEVLLPIPTAEDNDDSKIEGKTIVVGTDTDIPIEPPPTVTPTPLRRRKFIFTCPD